MKKSFLVVTISVTVILHQLLGVIRQSLGIQPPEVDQLNPSNPSVIRHISTTAALNNQTRPIPASIDDPSLSDSNQEDPRPDIIIPTQQQPLLLLSIEKNSTITSDIVKIFHETDSKEVCVALKQDARCPHPALLGRLSGPALAILEWKERPPPSYSSSIDIIGTVQCGSYGHYWLNAGDYFVEIIILFCNDFGVNALQRTGNLTAWMEVDPKLQHVEDVRYNRITSKEEGRITIHIPTPIEGQDSYRRGRWIRKHARAPQPLFTRVQPPECWNNKPKEGSPLELYCGSIINREWHGGGLYQYKFQWNMKVSQQKLVAKLRQRLQGSKNNNMPKICAIGDSHSRKMVFQSLPRLKLEGLFEYIYSPWIDPDDIAEKIAKHNKLDDGRRDCNIFFVQVGLWEASSKTRGNNPNSFGKYYAKLKQHVQNILQFNPNATLYLPTVDQNPLMAEISNAKDWRTPTLLDGYSYVNQMIVNELNTTKVKYIDTNFIIYTHWDGSRDWGHLMDHVRSRKTIYMAAIMLGETEWS